MAAASHDGRQRSSRQRDDRHLHEDARVLGEDFVFFLRVFLIDQRGDNLRHDVAHGLLQAEACNERIGALLFLSFLRLSALKRVGSGPSPS